jgi:hypothetical protein
VVVGEGGQANDQVRDHGGQGAKYWPPFVPWVQRGAGLGWVWSGGSTLVALGRCGVRWPVTPTGTGGGGGGSSASPPPYRYRRMGAGAGASRVLGSEAVSAAAPSTGPGNGAAGRRPVVCIGIAYTSRPEEAPFTAMPISAVRSSQSDQILCRFRLALQRKSGPRIADRPFGTLAALATQ